jgi:rod shape-determining protein MreD
MTPGCQLAPLSMDHDLIWFYRILICIAIIPAQTIFMEKFRVLGVKPDIALVVVFVQGWFRGVPNGLYWGSVLGGLLDLFSVGTLGIGLLMKSIVGAIAGFFGKSFLHLSIRIYIAIFLIISLLHDVVGRTILHGLGADGIQSIPIEEITMRALYNAVLGLVAVSLIKSRINRQELEDYGGTIFSPGKK